jgi:hypothetical protein
MSTAKGLIYEYACHEGNYALEAILAGARFEEQTARKAAQMPNSAGGAPRQEGTQ